MFYYFAVYMVVYMVANVVRGYGCFICKSVMEMLSFSVDMNNADYWHYSIPIIQMNGTLRRLLD